MKKNKWFILPVFALGFSTIVLPLSKSSNLFVSNEDVKKSNENIKYDFSVVKNYLNSSNKNINKKSLLETMDSMDLNFGSPTLINHSSIQVNDQPKTNYVSKEAFSSKAKEYAILIAENKFDYNDLLELARKRGLSAKEYSSLVNKQIENIKNNDNKPINANLKLASYSNNYYYNRISKEKMNEYVNSIKRSAEVQTIIATSAVAVAAAYWIFFATWPSAVAATTQAAVCIANTAITWSQYAAVNSLSNTDDLRTLYNVNLGSSVFQQSSLITSGFSTYSLTKNIVNSIKNLKEMVSIFKNAQKISLTIKGVVTATSWAAPTGLIFLTVCDIIVSAVDTIYGWYSSVESLNYLLKNVY
ncbi:hypothetical protein [Mycoplasma bradburyae]|uniref:Uncharacterized protein n=1 Tax=Mycoplasma bradburyae TaxID=2963128 RepID=A0ABT5GB32_9MOLU|nr:hypothetical protein [Mycoplasma bradburyae]MDC4182194.1 hypothetical protein [Mycoplasma bradburyae]UTS70020.1 hypothetical protein NMG68_03275 [Mycoplasma bradburyae]